MEPKNTAPEDTIRRVMAATFVAYLASVAATIFVMAWFIIPVEVPRTPDEIGADLVDENPPPDRVASGATSMQQMLDFYGAVDEVGNPATAGVLGGEDTGTWDSPGWYHFTAIVSAHDEGVYTLRLAGRSDAFIGIAMPVDPNLAMPVSNMPAELCARLAATGDGVPGWVVAGMTVHWPSGPKFYNLETK